ncbi:MAG: diphthamide biosynthesis enzyme Dph2 [Candidatus Methanofastidiosia archaeon]
MLQLGLEELYKQVCHYNPRVIGIQLPAGLRRKAQKIANFFEGKGYDVIFSGDPSYGACDIADEEMHNVGADLLVHFGHSPMLKDSALPVIYWCVRDDVDLLPVVREHLEMFKESGKVVGLLTTVQHIHKLDDVKGYLESKGMHVNIGSPMLRVSYPGQVLGCSFETAHVANADFYIFLGTGFFHSMGVSLATRKKVFCCDPYSMQCEDIEAIKRKIILSRYAAIENAKEKHSFGVIVSTKRGQYRLNEALAIKKLLKENGKKCQLIFVREITSALICDFDFDAYVVAACPRIAIDEKDTFDKPVLTVAEAELMFNNGEYLFDEIHKL